jgi:hypothetical protein
MSYRGTLLRSGAAPIPVEVIFDSGAFAGNWNGSLIPDEAEALDGPYLLQLDEGPSNKVEVYRAVLQTGKPVTARFHPALHGSP